MSFVEEIITDNRVGARNLAEQVSCKDLEQAKAAVRRLDGKQFTEVILAGANRDLTISGGNDSKYIVFLSIGQDQEFYNLTNPAYDPLKKTPVVAGGQLGMFPALQIVSLDAAVRAVEEFYETGQASPQLTWQRQDAE